MLCPPMSSLALHRVECVGSSMFCCLLFTWLGLTWISIREFTTPSFPVYMYDADGAYKVMTMGEVRIHPILFDCSH